MHLLDDDENLWLFESNRWKAQYPDQYELQPDGTYKSKADEWKGPLSQTVVTRVKILDELEKRGKCTPDFRTLRQQKEIPLFVYGDEQRGGRLNNLLNGSKFLGRAFSTSDMYVMKQPSWPLLFSTGVRQNALRGYIKGEIYVIWPELLLYLDQLKSNGKLFTREFRSFFLRDQHMPLKYNRKGNPSIQAWVYLANDKHWTSENMANCILLRGKDSKRKYYEYNASASSSLRGIMH